MVSLYLWWQWHNFVLWFVNVVSFQNVNSTVIHAWILPNLFMGLYSWSIWGFCLSNECFCCCWIFLMVGGMVSWGICLWFYFLTMSLSSWCEVYKVHVKHCGKCSYCFYYVKELVQDWCYFFLIIYEVRDFRHQGLEFICKNYFSVQA